MIRRVQEHRFGEVEFPGDLLLLLLRQFVIASLHDSEWVSLEPKRFVQLPEADNNFKKDRDLYLSDANTSRVTSSRSAEKLLW